MLNIPALLLHISVMAAPALALALAIVFFPGIHVARELIGDQKILNPSGTKISAANELEERSATPVIPSIPSIPSLPSIPGIPVAGNFPPIGKGPLAPVSGSIPAIPVVPIPGIGSAPVFPAPFGFPTYGIPPGHTGTCTYWGSNPGSWPKVVSKISTISSIFGRSAVAIFGGKMTVLEALQNNRNDAYGDLLREATASLLNSYADSKFPFTAESVKKDFNAALGSANGAAAQARLFAKANGVINAK